MVNKSKFGTIHGSQPPILLWSNQPLPKILAEATVQKFLTQTEEGAVWNGGLIEANFSTDEAIIIQIILLG